MDVSFRTRGIQVSPEPVSPVITECPIPARVRVLLRQESGLPCRALVEPGERVTLGQRIAAGVQPFQADLHAPVSGWAEDPQEVPLPDGSTCSALVIRTDGEQDWPAPVADANVLERPRADLLERIRRAGVVQGGREPRSLAALIEEALSPLGYVSATGTPLARPVRAVALRFVDEDPFLATAQALALEIDRDVADLDLGLQLLKRLTGAERVHLVLAVGQRLPAVEALADQHDYVVQRVDPTRYPSASDVAISTLVSGREPDVETHSVHTSGVLVLDAATAVQVARAARDERPVVDRVLTLRTPRGRAVLRAHIGASLAEVCAAAGLGELADAAKIVLGGPMRGLAHYRTDYPLTRDLAGVWLFEAREVRRATNHPCVGCGLCVEVCPMRLIPGLLSRYCEYAQWERAEEAHLFTCIECGCCAWVCPAGRSMVHLLVHGKSEVLAMRRPA